MQFTLVSTVFNEAKRLQQTISDLEKQTLQPSEIIITDAGSNDGTYEMLQNWASICATSVVILQKHRCNVAEGRNLAIKAAKYDLIASTDFGCRFQPDWLENLMQPFENKNIEAVGGAYSIIESDQTSLASKADYIISDGYQVNVHAKNFIPSSRSIAYKKNVFDSVGGYPEWLTLAGDDMVFGLEVLAKGHTFTITEKPCVSWLRHSTAKGYIKENFRYGLGNGEARIDYQNFLRYITQPILRALFIISLILVSFSAIPFYIALIAALISFKSYLTYYGYAKRWLKLKSAKYNFGVFLYGFILYEQTKLGYIKGYIKGYYRSPAETKKQAQLLALRLNKQLLKHEQK